MSFGEIFEFCVFLGFWSFLCFSPAARSPQHPQLLTSSVRIALVWRLSALRSAQWSFCFSPPGFGFPGF
jgi:hypothetical protein